jgi:TRAP-type C4-dicarboxylate transport system substrate-binding protein
MMKRRKFEKRLLAVFSIGALLWVGILGFAHVAGAQQKTVVWNLPHVAAPTYYHTINLKAFAEKLKEISKGRMEVRVHPASSLYPQQELIPAIVDGRVEVGPFMTNTIQEHRAAAFKLRPFYAAQLAKKGVLLKAIETWPSQQVYTTKVPIAKADDWKGKKIRIYGVEASEFVKSMGAAPVNIPFGELYTALQRNVVDGAVTSATNAEPMKFFEVTKYLNYWHFNAASPEWLGVNKKAWDALPPDLRKAFDQALKESRFEEKEWEDAIAWDLRARKRIQELGMTVVDIPKAEIEKAREKSKPVWKMWLKRTGADGKKALEEASKALGRPLL